MTQLTLLQKAVIQRLRDAGLPGLAALASEQWKRGEKVGGIEQLIANAELRADFETANDHASGGS